MQRDRKILSIDGSGFRGLAQLHLLDRLMRQINAGATPNTEKRPADVFDLICGTAAGGLLAIFLGRLGMSCSEAHTEYLALERTLFVQPGAQMGPNGTWEISDLLRGPSDFNTQAFQAKIKNIVKTRLGNASASDTDTRFLMSARDQHTDRCRTLVTVVMTTNANGDDDAVRIRSYDRPSNVTAYSPTDWKVWDAAIGTTACPQLFSPFSTSSGIYYQAANASGFANPSMIAYLEALDLFGTRSDPPPLTLVSLGMGLRERHDYDAPRDDEISKHIAKLAGSDPKSDRLKDFLRQTQLVAVATRIKDLRVANLVRRTGASQRYFRFDPPRDNRNLVVVDFAQEDTIITIVKAFWDDLIDNTAKSTNLNEVVTVLRGTWAWKWIQIPNHTNDREDAQVARKLTQQNAQTMMDECHQWEQANQGPNQVITSFTVTTDGTGECEMITGPVQPSLKMGSTLYVRILLQDNMRFFSQQSFTEDFDDDVSEKSPVDLIRQSTKQNSVRAFNSTEWTTTNRVEPENLVQNYHRFNYPHQGTWVRKK